MAGSTDLAHHLLDDPRLETTPVSPDDSHWIRTPPWISGLADRGAADLLRDGQVTIETSLGLVRATARRRLMGRRMSVDVKTFGFDDSESGPRWTHSTRSEETLRTEIAQRLEEGVLDLVN